MKKSYCLFTVLMLCLFISFSVIAHPGRLDSRGGHYVRSPGQGYPVGSYHYHDGTSDWQDSDADSDSEKIDIKFSHLPAAVYVGTEIKLIVLVDSQYKSYVSFKTSDEYLGTISENKFIAQNPGTVTITAYINEYSFVTKDIEIFPIPEEILSLSSERSFAFVGIPFVVNYDSYFIVDKNAPEWKVDNPITYFSNFSTVKPSKDFQGAHITFNGKAKFTEVIRIKSKYGSYDEIEIKVYNLNLLLLLLISVLIILFVFIKRINRKRRNTIENPF